MTEISYWISHSLEVNWAIVGVIQASLVVALVSQGHDLVRFLRTVKRSDRKGLVNLALGGFVVLFGLAAIGAVPAKLMHENFYGYMLFAELAKGEPVRDVYGLGYFAWLWPFLSVGGAKFALLFLGVSVAFLWGVVSLFAAVARTKLGGWSAFASAVLIITHPVLIRFARSESMITLAMAFALVAAERGVAFLNSKRWHSAIACGLLVAVSAQTRPEFYVVAPLIAISFAVWAIDSFKDVRGLLRNRWVWLGVGLTILVWVVPVHNLIWRAYEGALRSASLLRFDWSEFWRLFASRNLHRWEAGNVALSVGFSPRLHAVLGGVGLVALLLTELRALPLVVTFWIAEVVWLPVQTALWVGARLQQVPVLLWVVFAGAGVFVIKQFVKIAYRRIVESTTSALIGFVAVALFFGGWSQRIECNYDLQSEFAFLRTALSKLPQNSTIVVPRGDSVVNGFFPDGHEALKQRNITVVDSDEAAELHFPDVLFYRGLVCYKFANESSLRAAKGIRDECKKFLKFCSEPIIATRIDAPPYDFLVSSCRRCEIGFYKCSSTR